jgi:hypothetical protein
MRSRQNMNTGSRKPTSTSRTNHACDITTAPGYLGNVVGKLVAFSEIIPRSSSPMQAAASRRPHSTFLVKSVKLSPAALLLNDDPKHQYGWQQQRPIGEDRSRKRSNKSETRGSKVRQRVVLECEDYCARVVVSPILFFSLINAVAADHHHHHSLKSRKGTAKGRKESHEGRGKSRARKSGSD